MIKTAALIALGFASAMAFVKSTMPMDREPQAVRETPADDVDQNSPAMRSEREKARRLNECIDLSWDNFEKTGHHIQCVRVEAPVETPEYVRVWCRQNPKYCRRITQ